MDTPNRPPDRTTYGDDMVEVNHRKRMVATKTTFFKVLEYTEMGGPGIDIVRVVYHTWDEPAGRIGIKHTKHDTCKWCRTGEYRWI